MTATPRRVDYYTRDQWHRLTWWQHRRIRARRKQQLADAARAHHATYHQKEGNPK